MSSIDAAIIKALVEHIGGNPDSIPDGTIGGGGGSNTLSFRYEPLNIDQLTYTRDDDRTIRLNKADPIMFVPGHTVLRLKRKDSGVIDTYICIKYELYDSHSFLIDFGLIVNDNPFQPSLTTTLFIEVCCYENNEYHVSINVGDDFEVPSTETSTGFYKLVVEGESDNDRIKRENFVQTQKSIISITGGLMACMRASNIVSTEFNVV